MRSNSQLLSLQFLVSALLVNTFMLLASPVVRADDVVSSDFAFQLDASVFQAPEFNLKQKLEGSEAFQVPDFTISDEVPVQVRGVSGQIQYKIRSSSDSVFLGAELFMVSDHLSAKVRIGEVLIDTIVTRRMNGVLVRARLKARCANIDLELAQGKAQVQASLKADVDDARLPRISMPWYDLKWAEDAWSISRFECEGAEGYQQLVSDGLKKFLKSSAGLSGELRFAIDERIQNYQTELRAWFLAPKIIPVDIDGLRVELHPKAIARVEGDRFQVWGKLEFISPNSGLQRHTEIKAQEVPQTLPGFVLWVPEQIIPALNELSYRSRLYDKRKSAREFPAFESMRNSFFARNYVWPELGRFDKDDEFFFDFMISTQPLVSRAIGQSDGTLSFSAKTNLEVQTLAPTRSGHEGFVNFQTPIDAQLKLSFKSVGQGSELKVHFEKLKTQVTAFWDSAYKPKLKNDLLRIDTLESNVVDSLKSSGLTFNVGKIPLSSVLNLKATQFRKQGSWILIDWK